MSNIEEIFPKLNFVLRDGINRHLNRLGWNLKTLSEKSCISYETLKKLANAKIDNPSLTSTIKIARAFNVTLETLMGIEDSLPCIFPSLGRHSQNFILSLIKIECACQKLNEINKNCYHIPLFEPSGQIADKMPNISWNFSTLDIGRFCNQNKETINFALKITSQNFMPYLFLNQIALMSTDTVPPGKICVIIHENYVYLRKYTVSPYPKYIPFTLTSDKREFLPSDNIIVMGYISQLLDTKEYA